MLLTFYVKSILVAVNFVHLEISALKSAEIHEIQMADFAISRNP